MSDLAKEIGERRGRRLEKLRNVEDEVNKRLVEPWETKLFDLVLYGQMNRRGVRMDDINKLIAKELEQIK